MAERPRRRSPRRSSSALSLHSSPSVNIPASIPQAPLGHVMITGGGGFLGLRLAAMIHSRALASSLLLFDVRKPDASRVPPNTRIMEGDLRVVNDCLGINTIFHIASYGMSGLEMLNVAMIYAVNVQGTENLLQACRDNGVARLIYTSTYNTVFCGEPLCGLDDAPYAPEEKHADHYSRTKGRAERIVRAANVRSSLQTCALRAAGIYGDGEERHFPRVIDYMRRGLATFLIGPPDSLVEWVYVDNLAHAHILAAQKLTITNSPVAGNAYFVSDQHPINNFEFFRPLYDGLGYSFPKLRLPLMLGIFVAFVMEILHTVLRPLVTFQPLLTRTEVYKCAVSHYFSFTRVQRDIGYYPIVPYADAMRRTVQFYQARYAKPSPPPSSVLNTACSGPAWLLYALLLAMLTYIAQLRWSSPVA